MSELITDLAISLSNTIHFLSFTSSRSFPLNFLSYLGFHTHKAAIPGVPGRRSISHDQICTTTPSSVYQLLQALWFTILKVNHLAKESILSSCLFSTVELKLFLNYQEREKNCISTTQLVLSYSISCFSIFGMWHSEDFRIQGVPFAADSLCSNDFSSECAGF